MNELRAVLIGASGLTGNLLLEELLHDKQFSSVRVLGRSFLNIKHPKLHQEIVDFNNVESLDKKLGEGEIIFCCIGTTLKKVKGDKDLYTEIDSGIPLNVARIGLLKGFKKFLIISAVGANEKSSNFYLNLKGKTENALKQLSFESLSIFQPSVLNGNRKEVRTKERIFQTAMDLLSFMLLGPLEKYRAIGADNVAKAMAYDSKQKKKGIHYYTYSKIMDLAHLNRDQRQGILSHS